VEEIQKMKAAGIRLATPAASVRRPSVLAELAWERWQAGDVDDEAALAPIYLHTEGTPPV
jgi:tRNA threonylcarbamoyladenosine biosynthesis protein TsaB